MSPPPRPCSATHAVPAGALEHSATHAQTPATAGGVRAATPFSKPPANTCAHAAAAVAAPRCCVRNCMKLHGYVIPLPDATHLIYPHQDGAALCSMVGFEASTDDGCWRPTDDDTDSDLCAHLPPSTTAKPAVQSLPIGALAAAGLVAIVSTTVYLVTQRRRPRSRPSAAHMAAAAAAGRAQRSQK